MTLPDPGYVPDEILDAPPVGEAQPALDDAPAETLPTLPEPVTPPVDLAAQVAALTDTFRQSMEFQRQQAERQAQPAPPPAWVDPYDRPENTAKLDDLEERASFDPEARAALRTFRRQLDDERMEHRLGEREALIRQELQATQTVQTVERQLLTEATQHGDLVSGDDVQAVAAEVFRDLPTSQRAAALQDPGLRKLLVEAAAGRRLLSGKQPVAPNAPRPAPPAQVRSGNNATPAPSKATQANWADPDYMAGVMADAWNNPGKFGGK